MNVIIETFSKKDTMYRIKISKLSESLKNKQLVTEIGIPDIENIKSMEDKHKRFHTIDITRAAGVLSDFKVNDDNSITANFKPSELYKKMFEEKDIPTFDIRCLTKPMFDEAKSTREIIKVITWDLIDTKKGDG